MLNTIILTLAILIFSVMASATYLADLPECTSLDEGDDPEARIYED